MDRELSPGDFCDADIDGCEDDPCFKSVICRDLSPAEQAIARRPFECGECPAGYLKDNRSQECYGRHTQRHTHARARAHGHTHTCTLAH